ncbi:MAG: amino acid permease [Solirubrobacterales bacterium]
MAPQTFARSASGLVRELSIWDAMWFGVLASGLFAMLVYVFPYPQFTTPGISIPLTLLVATICTVPVAITYAGLGSAMPRAGGDYLFQSRSISPFVGFIVPLGWAAILWTVFFPISSSIITEDALIPALLALGNSFNSAVPGEIAEWLLTEPGRIIFTLALGVCAWAVAVKGIAFYRKLQRRIFMPAIGITFVTFLVILLTTSTGSFADHFNSNPVNAEAGVTVESIIAAARHGGWSPPSFSLGDTLLWVTILMGAIPFAVFAAEGMLGEIKGARNFRKMAGVFILGAFIIGVAVLALVYLLFERMASKEFISAASFAYNTGAAEIPTGMNVSALTSAAGSSPIPALLLAVGFTACSFQLLVSINLNVTRMLISMGLDRSLPPAISKINTRTRSPIFATTLYLVLCMAAAVFFITNPDWYTPLISTSAVSGEGILLFSCIAGFLLPFRNKPIYEASPIARHKVLGLPLLSVASGVASLILLFSWIEIMTNDKLGVTGAGLGLKFDPRALVLAPLVIAAVIFAGWRWAERRRGIDPSLAFKEIPPE